jgi:intein-encoded DNA endonuclease-like protein
MKESPNHTKKLAQLYYQDKILSLRKAGLSVREITTIINNRFISRSRFKDIRLSKSTIFKIIKNSKEQK